MLSKYVLLVQENESEESGDPLVFECMAQDYAHACEQALDAYRGGRVIDGTRMHPMPSVGDKVWWSDPDDGISSGPYTVLEIRSESGEVDFPDTLISIRNAAGSQAEVFAHELRPVPSVPELAMAVLNSESDEGCDAGYTVVSKPELMALLEEIISTQK